MQELKKWKVLQSSIVFNNLWCKVRQDKIELPNGKIIDDFFVNIRPEITLIVAVTQQQELILVRQYRHGVGEILLELPGGGFNPEIESAEVAAMRELQEETGYITQQVTQLAILYDNPVKDTNKINLFLATDVRDSGQQNWDVTEDVEVVLVPLDEVRNKITKGEICVSGSVTGIFLALDYLNK